MGRQLLRGEGGDTIPWAVNCYEGREGILYHMPSISTRGGRGGAELLEIVAKMTEVHSLIVRVKRNIIIRSGIFFVNAAGSAGDDGNETNLLSVAGEFSMDEDPFSSWVEREFRELEAEFFYRVLVHRW